jgi:hypothetical protein
MAHTLRRITTIPATPLRILVDQPEGDDVGMTVGGSFLFAPAGEEGDTAQVSERAAQVIMGDPGQAVHFECSPPLAGAVDAGKPKGKGKGSGPA